jgi:hypothetical protein
MTWSPVGCAGDPDCTTCYTAGTPTPPAAPTGEWTIAQTNAGNTLRTHTVSDATALGTTAVGNLGFSVANRSSQDVSVTSSITNMQGLGLTIANTAATTVAAVDGQVRTTPTASSAQVTAVYNYIVIPMNGTEIDLPIVDLTTGVAARVVISIAMVP